MTALIKVDLTNGLSRTELGELMEAAEEQRAKPDDIVTEAVRAKLAERRQRKLEMTNKVPTAA